MYKKDLITAELNKLAEILAKIVGLKLDLKLDEANEIFEETMKNSFSLEPELLKNNNTLLFKNWLEESEHSAEKLDSLSEFLYYELGISPLKNQLIAPKLNLIYEELANKHKTIHLVNLHRQKTIQQYL